MVNFHKVNPNLNYHKPLYDFCRVDFWEVGHLCLYPFSLLTFYYFAILDQSVEVSYAVESISRQLDFQVFDSLRRFFYFKIFEVSQGIFFSLQIICSLISDMRRRLESRSCPAIGSGQLGTGDMKSALEQTPKSLSSRQDVTVFVWLVFQPKD